MRVSKLYQTILSILLIIICLINANSPLIAQNRLGDVPAKPHNCEDALAILDFATLEAQKDKERSLIVIAHLGDSEKSSSLNWRRLKDVRENLSEKGMHQIVMASGERVKGFGRLEFYVGGKLLYVIAYPRNGRIDCRSLG